MPPTRSPRRPLRRLVARAAAVIALHLCAGCLGDPLPPPPPPAVVDGRAYVAHDGLFFAVDARSGALVRSVTAKGFIDETPPAVFDGVLYVGGSDLSAIEIATGNVRWAIPGAGRNFQQVTVDAEHVYFQSTTADDARLGAVDRATGRELWSVATPRLGAIVPAREVVITTAQSIFAPRLVARDARTGAERWAIAEASRVAPVVAGNRLFIVPEGLKLVARELDLETGGERWRDNVGETARVVVVIERGALYLQHGSQVRALDLATKQQRWSAPCAGRLGVGGGLVVCVGGRAVALRAETGASAWQAELPEEPWVPPVIADGLVCVRSKAGPVLAFDVGSGKLLWQLDMKQKSE